MSDLSITFAGKKESVKLKRFGRDVEENLQQGLGRLGKFMERNLKQKLRYPNPTTFFFKSPHRELRSRTSHLRDSITTEMRRLEVRVGPAGPPSRYGMVHEYGATIGVTEKMRRFLHAKGIHLRKSTTEIIISKREWFWPTWKENKRTAIKKVMDAIMEPVRR